MMVIINKTEQTESTTTSIITMNPFDFFLSPNMSIRTTFWKCASSNFYDDGGTGRNENRILKLPAARHPIDIPFMDISEVRVHVTP